MRKHSIVPSMAKTSTHRLVITLKTPVILQESERSVMSRVWTGAALRML